MITGVSVTHKVFYKSCFGIGRLLARHGCLNLLFSDMRGAARLGRPFSRQQRRPSVDYILGPVIGAGSHGYVQSATCKETGAEVAIKTIHGNRKVHGLPNTWPSAAAKEAAMLDHVRHPGVGRLHGSYAQTNELYHLVTELCRGVTLQDLIQESGPLSEHQALDIMRELLSVVDGVHSAGVAHLDVKPGNIILEELTEGGVQLKLVDFGSSELLNDAGVALPGVPGTGGYVAPEGYTKQFHANSDAYSCGTLTR